MVTHESGTFDPLGDWPQSLIHFAIQMFRVFQIGSVPDRTDPEEVVLPPYYPDIAAVRREMARHYDNIAVMDRQVGEILAQLEQQGLAETTVVIWTTDHGDGLPRAKRELYDSGIKVPMIIRWPQQWRPEGLAPGAVDQRLISFVDLAPTILALAGVESPGQLHGRDFLSGERRRYVYAARDRIDEVVDRQRAVRDERFKYIRSWYPQQAGGHELAFRDIQAMTRRMRELWRAGELAPAQAKWFEPVGEEQLYDLAADPFELDNLADDPAYRRELQRMRGALEQWVSRVGDTSEQPEAAMVAEFLCAGEQCRTPTPVLERRGGRVHIHSETPGASLAYRIDDGRWQLYTGPVETAGTVTAKAVRYGWEESGKVVLKLR